jgi:hypothetical protein
MAFSSTGNSFPAPGIGRRRLPRVPRLQEQTPPRPEMPPGRSRCTGQSLVPIRSVGPPRLPPPFAIRVALSAPRRPLPHESLLGVVARLPHRVLRVLQHRFLAEARASPIGLSGREHRPVRLTNFRLSRRPYPALSIDCGMPAPRTCGGNHGRNAPGQRSQPHGRLW